MQSRVTRLLKPYPFEELRAAFSFQPDGYRFMPRFMDGTWDGCIRFLKYDKVPTGLFLAIRETVEKECDVQFEISDATDRVTFRKFEFPEARPYQHAILEAMKKATARGGGIVKAATGAGKTRIAGMYFKCLPGCGLFVVDELTLLEQARLEIEKVVGEKIGVVGRSEFVPERISVATIQTLHRHLNRYEFKTWLRKIHTTIVDEFHVMLNRRQNEVMDSFRPPVVIGLTATLDLEKEWTRIRAYAMAGPVIYEIDRATATKAGYLTSGIVVQLSLGNGTKPSDEGYADEYAKLVVRDRTANEAVADIAAAAVAAGRKVVILVERIHHLKILGRLISERNIDFRLAYGAKSAEHRRESIRDFEEDRVNVIIANRVFGKGVDIRKLDFIIDATGGLSADACIQRFGRGVRLSEGKRALIYVDINHEGLVHTSFDSESGKFLSRETFGEIRAQAFLKNKIRVFRLKYRPDLNIVRMIQKAEELSHEETRPTQEEEAVS